jgi:hypothetical protein
MRHTKRIGAAAIVIVLVGGVGTAVAAVSSGGSSPPVVPAVEGNGVIAPPNAVTIPVKVNAKGETYGPAAGDNTSQQLPDLIRVRATNGSIGYITRATFVGPTPTLTQVRSYPKNGQGDYSAPSRTVPVYTSNGTTEIGVFTFSGGTSQ